MQQGARQRLNPPYALDQKYRIVETSNPATNILVKYIGPNPHNINIHQFELLPSGTGLGYLSINLSTIPPPDKYVVGELNAGGRRRHYKTKRARKTRRTRRNNKKRST